MDFNLKIRIYIISTLISLGCFSVNSHANDGGHDAPKTDEHGGGEHGTPTPKTEMPEWVEMQSILMGMETRILQKQVSIKKLIEEKEHVKPGSPAIKLIIEELVSESRELQKIIIDYEKESTQFKYRFPERGAKADRTYQPLDSKTLREIEQELGLDGRLTRNLNKVRAQYKPKKKEAPPVVHSEEKAPGVAEDKLNQDIKKSSGDTIIILKK